MPKTKRGGGKGAQWAMKQQHSGWHSQTSQTLYMNIALQYIVRSAVF